MSSPRKTTSTTTSPTYPGDFLDTSTQAFDPVYMGKLYDLGFRMAQAGYPWKKTPPRMAGH